MYVERDIKVQFDKISKLGKTIALVGPRQSGKTTFLKQRSSSRIGYLLFDDPDIRHMFEEDIKGFQSRYLEGNDVTILDEVQVCKDAGINLKYLNDTGNGIWMTSSSELLLGKEVLSYLVGRVSVLRLYPFSLEEIMRARDLNPKDERQVRRGIRDMISYGCYPDIVLQRDPELKDVQLRNLFETMVLKDIARVFNFDDIDGLQRTIRFLSNIYAGILNFDKISRDLSISYKTLRSYISAMEKSYLVKLISPYFSNPNKEIVKQPKIYFLDNGMRNVISGRTGIEPDGPSFENLVLTELLKADLDPKYWRKKTGTEVDFIVRVGDRIVPLEVKLRVNDKKVESGLRSFIRSYSPHKAFVVIFEGEKGKTSYKGTRVEFIGIDDLKPSLKNAE